MLNLKTEIIMKTLVLFLFVFASTLSMAQNNPLLTGVESFENWETLEGGDLPKYWDGFNREIVMSGFPVGIITTVTKDSMNAFDGNYAVKLKSESVLGGAAVPGMLTTGSLDIDFVNQTGDVTGGLPYTGRPSSFKGFVKHWPSQNDTAIISVVFKYQGNEIGEGSLLLNDTLDSWTSFDIPIHFSSAQNPDTMLVFISTSTRKNNVPMGSELHLDQIKLDYNTHIFTPESQSSVHIYPNPSNGIITIESNTIDPCMMNIYDLNGNLLYEEYAVLGTRQLNFSDFPKGVYLIRIVRRETTYSQKIVLQ
jgi:hypothetical protein